MNEQIIDLYEQASLLTEMTGERWEVDHIDPLKNNLICGLHVPWNLKAVTMADNRKKHNKFTPYRIDGEGIYYELEGQGWKEIRDQ